MQGISLLMTLLKSQVIICFVQQGCARQNYLLYLTQSWSYPSYSKLEKLYEVLKYQTFLFSMFIVQEFEVIFKI